MIGREPLFHFQRMELGWQLVPRTMMEMAKKVVMFASMNSKPKPTGRRLVETLMEKTNSIGLDGLLHFPQMVPLWLWEPTEIKEELVIGVGMFVCSSLMKA